jgi:hypothetical protein
MDSFGSTHSPPVGMNRLWLIADVHISPATVTLSGWSIERMRTMTCIHEKILASRDTLFVSFQPIRAAFKTQLFVHVLY